VTTPHHRVGHVVFLNTLSCFVGILVIEAASIYSAGTARTSLSLSSLLPLPTFQTMSVKLQSFKVEGRLAQQGVSLQNSGTTSYGAKGVLAASLPEGLKASLTLTDRTVQSVRASGGRGRAGQSARSRARGRRESAAPIVGSPARLSPRARSSSTTCRCSRRTPPWRSRRTVRVALEAAASGARVAPRLRHASPGQTGRLADARVGTRCVRPQTTWCSATTCSTSARA
jgi:hypothetical protein